VLDRISQVKPPHPKEGRTSLSLDGHGSCSKNLKHGTLRSLISDAGLTVERFIELLDG
jgi:hypothetical protein